MSEKKKHERFLCAAPERKDHVLECLHSLGNCSNPAFYAYDAEELPPIFTEIAQKLAETWRRMSCHCPYPFISAQLAENEVLEITGCHCRQSKLAAMAEVLKCLEEDGSTFVALEPIRNRYTKLFEDELCWTYPFCFDRYLGCVLLPVREGILCLPYRSLDSETYEQFEAEAVRLLTQEDIQALMDALLTRTMELYEALTDLYRATPALIQHSADMRPQKSEEVP